ncbi:hypothetical protein VTJ49DRAFT_3123 [Mycothermus thermophilus]|uniref:Phosphatidylinositol transfer protein SFH5 n=1 Tax=Humicola insolens TaxID=85995 RepID=A0ABR3V887_HUMIN
MSAPEQETTPAVAPASPVAPAVTTTPLDSEAAPTTESTPAAQTKSDSNTVDSAAAAAPATTGAAGSSAPAAEATAPGEAEEEGPKEQPKQQTEDKSKETAETTPIAQLWSLAKAHGHLEIWGVILSDPDNHVPTRIILQKYLNANDGDLVKAKDQLSKTLEWRAKTKPLDLIKKVFSKAKFDGLGYVTKYVQEGSAEPVAKEVFTWNIYGATKSIEDTFGKLDEFLEWRVALMELALQELDLSSATKPITADYDPYKIFQVHDYKSISFLRQSPQVKAASTETIKVFAQNYPELLKEKFFVNVPAIMGFMYAFMKLFVAPKTIKKFHPMSNGAKLAAEFADSKVAALGEKLPSNYGGKGADLAEQGKPIMSTEHATTGFVIDVDTVLAKDGSQKRAAPGAREAINKLQRHDIAFTIISSDSRTTEKTIKHDIERHLGLVVKSRFIVVPQTPCRDLVAEYGNQAILVVGDANGRARNFAHNYGFQHVMIPNDVVELFPHLYCDGLAGGDGSSNPPRKPAFALGTGSHGEVRIAAVFVWWSPPARHWDRDLRIVTDVLLSQAGQIGTHSADGDKQQGLLRRHLVHSPELQPRLFVCGAGIADPHAAEPPRARTWLDELQRRFLAESGGIPLRFDYLDDPDSLLHHADRALEFVNDRLHPWLRLGPPNSNGPSPVALFPRTVFRIGADTLFSAACSRVKNYPSHPNTGRRYVVVDPTRGGHVEATIEYPSHVRPWYVAASLLDAVDYALQDEYWACVEEGLRPTWPVPEGALRGR